MSAPHTKTEPVADLVSGLLGPFLSTLKGRRDRMASIIEAAKHKSFTSEQKIDLVSTAHKINGSSGSYGFPELGKMAQDIEQRLLKNPEDPSLSEGITALILYCDKVLKDKEYVFDAPPVEYVPRPNAPSRPLVLVVDDDPSIRSLLAGLLQDFANTIAATTADECFALMEQKTPDLVLLDDKMPGEISGIDLLDKIRNTDDIKDIPVVMLTANKSPDEVLRSISSGAVDYIVKPFQPHQIAERIKTRLERSKKSILIADDNASVKNHLHLKFKTAGYKTYLAETGDQALAIIREKKPSLILLDCALKSTSTDAVLKGLHPNSTASKTPVLLLVGPHEASIAKTLEQQYATHGLITKPCNPTDVLTRCIQLIHG